MASSARLRINVADLPVDDLAALDCALPAPKIRKGPHGSIDLHWQLPNRTLFVNVPTDSAETAEFFGHDGARGPDGRFEHTIQGFLDVADEPPWLLMWRTWREPGR